MAAEVDIDEAKVVDIMAMRMIRLRFPRQLPRMSAWVKSMLYSARQVYEFGDGTHTVDAATPIGEALGIILL